MTTTTTAVMIMTTTVTPIITTTGEFEVRSPVRRALPDDEERSRAS
jgi:hypothetical protein